MNLRQLSIDRRAPVVVFLQNAWSPLYAGDTWPRESWLVALMRSRSGQRLRLMISDPDWCENTTPLVGSTPDSVVEPDEFHIKRVLLERKPKVVVARGKQAEYALTTLWNGPLLVVPHPAHRLLTNKLYVAAGELLRGEYKDRLALRQRRGEIEKTKI